jgi:hypothetical protein
LDIVLYLYFEIAEVANGRRQLPPDRNNEDGSPLKAMRF